MAESKTIVFAGGGTAGPVTPLLAVADFYKSEYPDWRIVFVGTQTGPERKLVQASGYDFFAIPSSKLRRYFSLRNFLDTFVLPLSVVKAWSLLGKVRPAVVVSAGGYVAVPVVWAAKLRGIKVLVHQQDIIPGLANKLCLRFADIITYTFLQSAKDFPQGVLAGNPVREMILQGDKERGLREFGLTATKPTLLVFGGGTGAQALNDLMISTAPHLINNGWQIIHLTGIEISRSGEFLAHISEGYIRRDFLGPEMADAFALASVVVCRAGLGSITELSNLGKVAVIIPMPDSHQEANAELLERNNAARILSQKNLTTEKFVETLEQLRDDSNLRQMFSKNIFEIMPHRATSTIAQLVYNLAK